MRKRILSVAPFRAAAVAAVIGFMLSYPAIGVMWLINLFLQNPGRPNWLVLTALPVFTGVCISFFAFLGALGYNWLVKLGLFLVFDVAPEPSLAGNLNAQPELDVRPDSIPPEKYHRF